MSTSRSFLAHVHMHVQLSFLEEGGVRPLVFVGHEVFP